MKRLVTILLLATLGACSSGSADTGLQARRPPKAGKPLPAAPPPPPMPEEGGVCSGRRQALPRRQRRHPRSGQGLRIQARARRTQ